MESILFIDSSNCNSNALQGMNFNLKVVESSNMLTKKAMEVEDYDAAHEAWMNSKERKESLIRHHQEAIWGEHVDEHLPISPNDYNSIESLNNAPNSKNAIGHLHFELEELSAFSDKTKRVDRSLPLHLEEADADFMKYMNSAERKMKKIELHNIMKEFAMDEMAEDALEAVKFNEDITNNHALSHFDDLFTEFYRVEFNVELLSAAEQEEEKENHNKVADYLRTPERKHRMIKMHKAMKKAETLDVDFTEFYETVPHIQIRANETSINCISSCLKDQIVDIEVIYAAIFPQVEVIDEMSEIDIDYMNTAERKMKKRDYHRRLMMERELLSQNIA